jgi:hypothetical protein
MRKYIIHNNNNNIVKYFYIYPLFVEFLTPIFGGTHFTEYLILKVSSGGDFSLTKDCNF